MSTVMVFWDDDTDHDYGEVYGCPACGDTMDYCQGHGAIGDPDGHRVLWLHDEGDHTLCHPAACIDAEDD